MMAENSNKAQRLRELLKEDQEPFFLKDYIADRRSQLNGAPPKTHLHLKTRKPKTTPTTTTTTRMIASSLEQPNKQHNLPGKLCRKACFFSSTFSPDLRKSPLFEFPSPASRSPCKSPRANPILLHIPARTAALLLEAALRIQKQSSSNNKTKNQIKNPGFGLFGSLIKKLWHRKRNKEIDQKATNHVESILIAKEKPALVDETTTTGFCTSSSSSSSASCACTGRPSSAVWSESNEEKSSSTSTSHSGGDAEEIEFVTTLMMMRDRHDESFAFCDEEDIDEFCDQIQSPFRFVLQKSPSSSGHRTPEFSSPVSSPRRHRQEDKENYVAESSKEFQMEEEEEKEQFSPVSVLDPPFEDDYDGRDDDEEEDEDGFDLESSFAIVQRTKHQLLQKLRRFEKLAELDPIELEKRMLEDEDEDEDEDSYHFETLEEEEGECDDFESSALDREASSTLDGFIHGVLRKSSFNHVYRAPNHMKRLISDLIVEESREEQNKIAESDEEIVRRVCKRFESWKEVQSNTIDMMVEQDFRKELQGWKDNKDQIGEIAVEIELATFGLLVEELAEELVSCSGI